MQPTAGQGTVQAPVRKAVESKQGLSVKLEGLRAFYGEAEQVKGIDLDFHANEVTAIIGPSGCGKSTMVRCINRMHEEIPGAHAEGRVLLDEIERVRLGGRRGRRAARDRHGLPEAQPVPDDVGVRQRRRRACASARGADRRRADLRAKVEAALRGAGLWDEVADRLDEPGAGLSGGQQQRLCIARSLAVEPEVILMDEPCSALDPIATLKIEELIDELKQRVTIVIVTHNMQQAARVADRTAFMLSGELVEVGPTQEIFTNPNDSAHRGICHRQVRLAATGARAPRQRRPAQLRAAARWAGRRSSAARHRVARTSRSSCTRSKQTRSAAST